MQQIVGKIKSTIFQSDTGFFVGTFRVKETQNEELKDTVQWMHDLIWKMVKERESAKES